MASSNIQREINKLSVRINNELAPQVFQSLYDVFLERLKQTISQSITKEQEQCLKQYFDSFVKNSILDNKIMNTSKHKEKPTILEMKDIMFGNFKKYIDNITQKTANKIANEIKTKKVSKDMIPKIVKETLANTITSTDDLLKITSDTYKTFIKKYTYLIKSNLSFSNLNKILTSDCKVLQLDKNKRKDFYEEKILPIINNTFSDETINNIMKSNEKVKEVINKTALNYIKSEDFQKSLFNKMKSELAEKHKIFIEKRKNNIAPKKIVKSKQPVNRTPNKKAEFEYKQDYKKTIVYQGEFETPKIDTKVYQIEYLKNTAKEIIGVTPKELESKLKPIQSKIDENNTLLQETISLIALIVLNIFFGLLYLVISLLISKIANITFKDAINPFKFIMPSNKNKFVLIFLYFLRTLLLFGTIMLFGYTSFKFIAKWIKLLKKK